MEKDKKREVSIEKKIDECKHEIAKIYYAICEEDTITLRESLTYQKRLRACLENLQDILQSLQTKKIKNKIKATCLIILSFLTSGSVLLIIPSPINILVCLPFLMLVVKECTKILDKKEEEKVKKELQEIPIMIDNITKFRHKKENNWHEKVLNDAKFYSKKEFNLEEIASDKDWEKAYAKANYLLDFYLSTGYLINLENDLEVYRAMRQILQEELATNEQNLTQLLKMYGFKIASNLTNEKEQLRKLCKEMPKK